MSDPQVLAFRPDAGQYAWTFGGAPPVARITAFLARIFTAGLVLSMLPSERKLFNGVDCPGIILGVYSAVMPSTLGAFCPAGDSRMTLVILWFRRNLTPLARALFSSGLMTPVPGLLFGLSYPAPLVQNA